MMMRYIFISIIFFNVFWSCCSNAQQLAIGIEVETSSIKTSLSKIEEKKFCFKNKNEDKILFCLEQDTPDKSFSQNNQYKKFNKNLEIKTIGPFSYESLVDVVPSIQHLLTKFYEDSEKKELIIDDRYLNEILDKRQYYIIDDNNKSELSIKTSGKSKNIRLQITYQLPLSKISDVFNRLSYWKHKDIEPFVNVINPNGILLHPIDFNKINAGKIDKDSKIYNILYNTYINYKIGVYFREKIAKNFHELGESNSKGLIQLFLFYWYTLFNEKKPSGNEAGLKQYLGIMSRVPFSQLYDSLDPTEKEKFVSFLKPYMENIKKEDNFSLRDYHHGRTTKDMSEITLSNWFYSIVDPSQRIKHRNGYSTDILSPPPTPEGTENSMGSYDIQESSNLALIEARGYSTIEHKKDTPLTSDDLYDFIENEAKWFFNIKNKEK